MSAADVGNGFRGGRKKPGRRYARPAREELLDLLAQRELTIRRAAHSVQADNAADFNAAVLDFLSAA